MEYLGKDVDKIWLEDGEWCILFNTGVLLIGDFLTFDKNWEIWLSEEEYEDVKAVGMRLRSDGFKFVWDEHLYVK